MMKYTLIAAALMLPLTGFAAAPPASGAAPAPVIAAHPNPTRSAGLEQMRKCQVKAKALKGAAKEQAVQACMRAP